MREAYFHIKHRFGFIFALSLIVLGVTALGLGENSDKYLQDPKDENSIVRAQAAMALGELKVFGPRSQGQ
jgi:hypothetical protein